MKSSCLEDVLLPKIVKGGIIGTMLLLASGATYAASNYEKIQDGTMG